MLPCTLTQLLWDFLKNPSRLSATCDMLSNEDPCLSQICCSLGDKAKALLVS